MWQGWRHALSGSVELRWLPAVRAAADVSRVNSHSKHMPSPRAITGGHTLPRGCCMSPIKAVLRISIHGVLSLPQAHTRLCWVRLWVWEKPTFLCVSFGFLS